MYTGDLLRKKRKKDEVLELCYECAMKMDDKIAGKHFGAKHPEEEHVKHPPRCGKCRM